MGSEFTITLKAMRDSRKNQRLWAEALMKRYISSRQNLFPGFSRKKHDEVSQVVGVSI